MREFTSEDVCQSCGGWNPVWSVQNGLWNLVYDPTDERECVVCPVCFIRDAQDKVPRPNRWRVSPNYE